MSNYENAIEIRNITKKYDGFTLDNVSFVVPKGSIMGFIGQNGAGKSTTIRSLLNIIPVNSGEIRILGLDNSKHELLYVSSLFFRCCTYIINLSLLIYGNYALQSAKTV